MFSKTFTFFIISINSVLLSGQPSDTPITSYPIAPDAAQPCLKILNDTGVIQQCLTQSLNKWPINTNGNFEHKYVERDTCCQQYDQIDCKIQAITGGKCQGDSKMAAIKYENRLIKYWSETHCLSTPYESGIC